MSTSIADNWFGLETPKPAVPKVIPPAVAPSQDAAQERQVFTDRVKSRRGRASTRLSDGLNAGSPGQTKAFKLLSGAA